MNDKELVGFLPSIAHDANKYSRGSLLILAGSARFPGAAILAAKAAERAGAGYVTLAIPKSAAPIAQAHLLSTPVIAAPETGGSFGADAWFVLSSELSHIDAVVIGPGITDTSSTRELTMRLLRECKVPVLIDADALNVLSATEFYGIQLDQRHILTPHAGELSRLSVATGTNSAQELSVKTGAIIVEKGPTTNIVSPTQRISTAAGTPALAKAGTGDVLSGIIGALLAQGMSPFEAAIAGVEIHGRAGRIAEQNFGTRSVIAEDVIHSIPEVLKA
jgi:NAD(P)H-hydrate epimerase